LAIKKLVRHTNLDAQPLKDFCTLRGREGTRSSNQYGPEIVLDLERKRNETILRFRTIEREPEILELNYRSRGVKYAELPDVA
jgi:hypothetical protein